MFSFSLDIDIHAGYGLTMDTIFRDLNVIGEWTVDKAQRLAK